MVSVLATKASVLACLGQFEKSLSVAEMILGEEREHCLALRVKADSLFNLCMFEDALVMYHRLADHYSTMITWPVQGTETDSPG